MNVFAFYQNWKLMSEAETKCDSTNLFKFLREKQNLPFITAQRVEDMTTRCGCDFVAGRVQVQTNWAADFHCSQVDIRLRNDFCSL